jgi:TolA-binding protein
MNKISLIKNNKTEESHDNQVKKKSKFKKFLSSSMAVMVLTVGLSSPMTLRADDSQERVKKRIDKTIELIDEKIEENNKIVEEKNKRIEKNNEIIEKADKEIERNKKIVEEAKKEEMEARNKLCKGLEEQIPQMKDYCSKNKCDENQKSILKRSLNTYKEKCETLVVKSE